MTTPTDSHLPSQGPDDSPLAEDILAALSVAQAPAAARDPAIERVRGRLMKRVADDSTRLHDKLDANEGEWRRFLPGIDRKVLHVGAGVMSYLLKFEPGAVLPAHRHPVDEECVVIQGQLRIGHDIELGPGGFHRVDKDVLDAPSTTETGCVIYLRGAVPRLEHIL